MKPTGTWQIAMALSLLCACSGSSRPASAPDATLANASAGPTDSSTPPEASRAMDGAPPADSAAPDAGHDASLLDAQPRRDADARIEAGAEEEASRLGPCQPGTHYGAPLPDLEQDRRAVAVTGGFNFLEGPVWLADERALFFSDMNFAAIGPAGVPARMHRFVPGVGASVFIPNANSNGLAVAPDGHIVACTHDLQTLSDFDPQNGKRTPRPLTYMGKHFNSPNDLVIRSDGTIYFTDPTWQLPPRTSELGFTGVYRVTADGQVSLIDGSLEQPNGITLSPDEKTLYVGSASEDLLAYPVATDGSVGDPTVFASPGSSDGLGVDCAGNLYVSAGDVIVYDPEGRELGRIRVDETPSNVAFGGLDASTLYVTAGSTLYAIELRIPGYPY